MRNILGNSSKNYITIILVKMEQIDDGSLSFLNIPPDSNKKYFHCDEITQQKLLGKSFWVIDFAENIPTRYGQERYLVKIKFNCDDPDNDARKFFTNSTEIKYILDKIKELNKLPRKVTMRSDCNRFYFE